MLRGRILNITGLRNRVSVCDLRFDIVIRELGSLSVFICRKSEVWDRLAIGV